MMDWYDLNIEEPIREIVRALRNNGINTFCSCGHEMWVQAESTDPNTEQRTIYNVMSEMGIARWEADLRVQCSPAGYYHTWEIRVTPPPPT